MPLVADAALGGIGVETARLLKAFGATVLGVKRTVEPVEHVDEVHGRLLRDAAQLMTAGLSAR